MLFFSAAPVLSCDRLPPPSLTGNRCGHNPDEPNLQLPVPTPTGRGGHPRVLTEVAEKSEKLYFKPKWCARVFGSSRIIRSERREALVRVSKTLLHYFCLSDGFCTLSGSNAFNISDLPTIEIMADKAGLSVRRFKRALELLVKAGLVDCVQPRAHLNGNYYGLPAIRSLNVRFFELFGRDINFKKESRRAPERKMKKFGQNPAQRLLLGLVNGRSPDIPINRNESLSEHKNRKRELYNLFQRKFVERKESTPTQARLPLREEPTAQVIEQWHRAFNDLKQENLAAGGELQPSRWRIMASMRMKLPLDFLPPGFDIVEYKRNLLKEYGSRR